jgi:hypothetical protein
MKVQVYSNLSKNKNSKKIKSPSSMRNGRFNTSKYRGKLQKMGVMYTHSSIRLGPFPKLQKNNLRKLKKLEKMELLSDRATAGCPNLTLCKEKNSSSCPLFFAHVVNSSSLAPTYAHLAQTSPENFNTHNF